MHYVFSAFMTAVLFTTALTATAQDARRGFYAGIELGAAESRSIKSTRTNVGIPTNCDQWLPPVNLGGLQLPLPADQCQPRSLPASTSKFDLDTGWLASVQVVAVKSVGSEPAYGVARPSRDASSRCL